MSEPKLTFLAAATPAAQQSLAALTARYGSVSIEKADVIVSLGGDGFMLHTIHGVLKWHKPVFGLNLGTQGFLCNEYHEKELIERIVLAEPVVLHPLTMESTNMHGESKQAFAFNEVSLLRQTRQSAKLRVTIDGIERLSSLNGDGVMLATPAGSTAYNLSVHGPIIPMGASLLALTPIAAFRPRRWRGALIPSRSRVQIDVLEADKRPVSVAADFTEVRDLKSVLIHEDRSTGITVLFDPKQNLAEKMIQEQFVE
jgi:NAD+ kinase